MNDKELIWVAVQDKPLVIEDAFSFLQTELAGGIDLFVGTTRRWTEGRETVHLAYECYEGMALKEMNGLAQEAREKWPVERICMIHRTGVVGPSMPSVIIGVATPHRADAFEACRFLIDHLKKRVPIWKKEVYADGEEEWVQGSIS